jgi:hypothetical protein
LGARRLAKIGARYDRRVLLTLTDGLDEHTAPMLSAEYSANQARELGFSPDTVRDRQATFKAMQAHVLGALREAMRQADAEMLAVMLGDDIPFELTPPFPPEARVVRTLGSRQKVAGDVLAALEGRKAPRAA